MADFRIPPQSTLPVQRTTPAAGARADAVRAAQQAFFQAAMGRPEAQPAAPAKGAAPTAEPAAQRLLRPGSLVDVKV